ncbi:hypothetical protein A2881_02890 [Candidatus Peribacteria bacterium RIFCSPHIGHO2_01_FULL_55_13]|nr:MAG: hypothetical protein A2881_02890 [Candidatus Peribacteria bacterium RIFCSPHIGHO2_01_FULL_55_13]
MTTAGDRRGTIIGSGTLYGDALILGVALRMLVHAITAAEDLVACIGAGAGNGDASAALLAFQVHHRGRSAGTGSGGL